jgi:hypothetical protein
MFEAASSSDSGADRYVIITIAMLEIAEHTQPVFRKVVYSGYDVPVEILCIEICFEACIVGLLLLWMYQYSEHLLRKTVGLYSDKLVRKRDYYIIRNVVFNIVVRILLGYLNKEDCDGLIVFSDGIYNSYIQNINGQTSENAVAWKTVKEVEQQSGL